MTNKILSTTVLSIAMGALAFLSACSSPQSSIQESTAYPEIEVESAIILLGATPSDDELVSSDVESDPPQTEQALDTATATLTPTNEQVLVVEEDPILLTATQLALGTLSLEGTERAVSVEQASKLLPLWTAANDLARSTEATDEELETAFGQIQAAMTAEQVTAIQGMQTGETDEEEVMALLEALGLAIPAGPRAGFDPEMQATMQAARPDGMPTQGTPPAPGEPGSNPGGDRPAPDGTPPPGGRQGGGQAPSGANGPEGLLYQAVIELLTQKAQ